MKTLYQFMTTITKHVPGFLNKATVKRREFTIFFRRFQNELTLIKTATLTTNLNLNHYALPPILSIDDK